MLALLSVFLSCLYDFLICFTVIKSLLNAFYKLLVLLFIKFELKHYKIVFRCNNLIFLAHLKYITFFR